MFILGWQTDIQSEKIKLDFASFGVFYRQFVDRADKMNTFIYTYSIGSLREPEDLTLSLEEFDKHYPEYSKSISIYSWNPRLDIRLFEVVTVSNFIRLFE